MILKKPDMDTGEHLLFILSCYCITDEEYTRLTKGFCRRGFSDSEISYLKEVFLVPSILFMFPKQLHLKQFSQKKKNVLQSDLLVKFVLSACMFMPSSYYSFYFLQNKDILKKLLQSGKPSENILGTERQIIAVFLH